MTPASTSPASTAGASAARTWSASTSRIISPSTSACRASRRFPPASSSTSPDLYTEKELTSSIAYNEGLRRLGVHEGLNVRFDRPDGLRVFWALGNPVTAGGWQSAQLRLAEHLMPHVRQFVFVRQALAAADALGAGLGGLLESSRIGVLHLDRRGRVLAANAAALDILRGADGLSDQDGSLAPGCPGITAACSGFSSGPCRRSGRRARRRFHDAPARLRPRCGWASTSRPWATRKRISEGAG